MAAGHSCYAYDMVQQYIQSTIQLCNDIAGYMHAHKYMKLVLLPSE